MMRRYFTSSLRILSLVRLSLVVLSLSLSPAAQAAELLIYLQDDVVQFVPENLRAKAGEKVELKFVGEGADELKKTIFVKRDGIASLDESATQLFLQTAGTTKLFVITPDLAVHQLPLEVIAQAPLPMPGEDGSLPDQPAGSADQVAAQNTGMLVQHKMEAKWNQFRLKFYDDRSDLNDRKIYPADEIEVLIPVLGFQGWTDGRGEISLNAPVGAQVLMRFQDQSGRFMSGFKELTLEEGKETIDVHVVRFFAFNLMTSTTGMGQDANLASFCGRVSQEGTFGEEEAMRVALNVEADGPYYFNQLGLLDPALGRLDQNGRFCFFNVSPGLAAVSILLGESTFLTKPLMFRPGAHLEEDLKVNLEGGQPLMGELDLHPSAESFLLHGKWFDGEPAAYVDVLPFGEQPSARSDASGRFSFPDLKQAGHLYVSEVDLEPTVFHIEPGLSELEGTPVLTAFPKGFLADLALQSDETIDENLGNVVAHFFYDAAFQQLHGRVEMSLVDMDGVEQPARDFPAGGFEFSSFFNLIPGQYQLIARDSFKNIVSVKSIFVYSGTLSSVFSGAVPLKNY